MLALALDLDVNAEIERRLERAHAAKLEESSKLDEASARGGSVGNEESKKKKIVKFASPERFSSVHSYDQSSASVRPRPDESIGESIRIEESYSVSQALASGSLKKSADSEKHEEEDYSEDFERSSATVKSVQNTLARPGKREPDEEDIEYSMNFEESVQSQRGAMPPVRQGSQPQRVEEESQEEECEEEEKAKSQSSKVKESDEVPEEEVGSESMGATSSKLVDSSAVEFHEEDREVLQSAQSVEWIVNLDAESQRSVKPSEHYTEDFDQESKQIDELEDLESYPEDEEEEDLSAKADIITEEFLQLLLLEVRQNKDLNIESKADVEEFKDKFPFNLEPPIQEEPVETV